MIAINIETKRIAVDRPDMTREAYSRIKQLWIDSDTLRQYPFPLVITTETTEEMVPFNQAGDVLEYQPKWKWTFVFKGNDNTAKGNL